MDLTLGQQTIGMLVDQMSAASTECTQALGEAQGLILNGNQNGTIGALLGIERQIDLLKTLHGAVLAIHRIG